MLRDSISFRAGDEYDTQSVVCVAPGVTHCSHSMSYCGIQSKYSLFRPPCRTQSESLFHRFLHETVILFFLVLGAKQGSKFPFRCVLDGSQSERQIRVTRCRRNSQYLKAYSPYAPHTVLHHRRNFSPSSVL